MLVGEGEVGVALRKAAEAKPEARREGQEGSRQEALGCPQLSPRAQREEVLVSEMV